MLGIGGKHLHNFSPLSTGASVASMISFASTLASTDVSWCTMVADYGVYHRADASRYGSRSPRYVMIFMVSSV